MSKRTYLFVSAEVNHMCHRILEKSDFCSHSLSSPEMNFALRTRIIVILKYHKAMSLSSKQTGYQVTTTFNTVRYKQYEVWSKIIGSVAIKNIRHRPIRPLISFDVVIFLRYTLYRVRFPLMEASPELNFWNSKQLPRCISLDFLDVLKSCPFQVGFIFDEEKLRDLRNMVVVVP